MRLTFRVRGIRSKHSYPYQGNFKPKSDKEHSWSDHKVMISEVFIGLAYFVICLIYEQPLTQPAILEIALFKRLSASNISSNQLLGTSM